MKRDEKGEAMSEGIELTETGATIEATEAALLGVCRRRRRSPRGYVALAQPDERSTDGETGTRGDTSQRGGFGRMAADPAGRFQAFLSRPPRGPAPQAALKLAQMRVGEAAAGCRGGPGPPAG
jgi:hypothetical protein